MINWDKILPELKKAFPDQDTPYRVAVYSRVSTPNNQAFAKLQEQRLSEMVKANPALELVDTYIDVGVTRKDLYTQSAFRELLDDAMDGKFELVLTHSIGKIARSREELAELSDLVKDFLWPVAFVFECDNTFLISDNMMEWFEQEPGVPRLDLV